MSKKSESVPAALRATYEPIARVIDDVCAKRLNDEYKTLAHRLGAALARKRPSPLARGKPEVWACGILYALGTVNFLWDKTQTPHMRADELCKACGVSPASGSAKAKQIRDMFDLFQMNPDWTLPSMVEKNPLTWMLSVNGFLMDIRDAPLGAQIAAYEKGLIPYIPALGPEGAAELDALAETMQTESAPRRAAPEKNASQTKRRCGLCGSTAKRLTKTPCCNNWICDDEENYVLFSFAHNSCHRNHDRYTLCSSHYHEGHKGRWQECKKCRENFETEMYVWYGTNEYNFEKLENPPAFEPTHCVSCGRVIHLGTDGYMRSREGYFCEKCAARERRKMIAAERKK